jgi:hypothetical protein
MQNDPYKNFYIKGWEDAKSGKKSRIPQNYKLSYVSGRYDFVSGKENRYKA